MDVVVKDLTGTGARWIFMGDKVFVDPNFMAEYKREFPEKYWLHCSCHDIKLAALVVLVMTVLHAIINLIA